MAPENPPSTSAPPEGIIPLLPLGHDVWRVYTDGSVIGGCTGYGLVVVNSKGTVATCRGKLPPHCSIFQAEGLAILQALRYVATMATPTSSVEIFADSRAALTAIISATQISSPFTEIREILLSASMEIQMFWIASHRGHQGNEWADTLAKQGALGPGGPTDFLPLPTANIRRDIRAAARQSWSQSWNISTKASTTRAFIPDPLAPSHLHAVEVPYQVAQLLTGHCRLRSYLFKVKCAPSPLCPCNNATETFEHFLFYCTQFDMIRAPFKTTSLCLCKMWPPPLPEILRLKTLFLAFMSFIVKSKRLDL